MPGDICHNDLPPLEPSVLNDGGRLMLEKESLAEKFSKFAGYWSPRIAAEVSGFHVKLVKLKGEFVWHHHEREEELFLVVKGEMIMRLRDGEVRVGEGEFIVVPRGVEHMPVAEGEAHVLLFEPAGTVNTGSAGGERTVERLERI